MTNTRKAQALFLAFTICGAAPALAWASEIQERYSSSLTRTGATGHCLAQLPARMQPDEAGAGKSSADSGLANASSQTPGSPDAALPQQIDQLVLSQMSSLNLPGYALAVIKNGDLIVEKGYGFADLDRRQPVTPDTVFGLASLTKTFTAIVLLSLVEKGRLDLSDSLDKYLPGLPKSYQKLTLRQLATMTAGVPKKAPQEVPWTEQIEVLSQMPLVSQPGTSFLYSNFSYRLLGSVIQKVTGKSYLDMVASTVLAPCGMQTTGTTERLASTGLVATAYGPAPNSRIRKVQYKSPEVSFSAGMLASNLNDLLLYVRALLAQKLLSRESYQTMWLERPPLPDGTPSHWAFGWGSTRRGDTLHIAMNGGTAGVASTIILLPERNSAVIALSNLRKPPVYAIARKVAGLVFDTAVEPGGAEPGTAESGAGSHEEPGEEQRQAP